MLVDGGGFLVSHRMGERESSYKLVHATPTLCSEMTN